MNLDDCIKRLPLIAILRGAPPDKVLAIGEVLVEAGFSIIEVTMNSPEPEKSIRILSGAFGGSTLIGAGTILTCEDVGKVDRSGGKIIISPNMDRAVIRETKRRNMVSFPGVHTPTEAFAALNSGADAIKFFPAELATPKSIKAMLTVLPNGTRTFVVGGVSADNMSNYLDAGVTGFGIGSSLVKPGKSIANIAADAKDIVRAYRAAIR